MLQEGLVRKWVRRKCASLGYKQELNLQVIKTRRCYERMTQRVLNGRRVYSTIVACNAAYPRICSLRFEVQEINLRTTHRIAFGRPLGSDKFFGLKVRFFHALGIHFDSWFLHFGFRFFHCFSIRSFSKYFRLFRRIHRALGSPARLPN